MKRVLLVAGILSVASAISTPVQANENMAVRICEYIAANDKNRLRSFLKQNKLKVRKVFNSINCNADNMIIFAAKSKALEVGEFIIGKTPAKVVKANIEEIAKHSAHLAEEAKERIN